MKKINIITGHYGSGKTTVSVNAALKASREAQKVSIVDLDIVNPYFRTSDFSDIFKENNIELYAPVYAGTNLDIPAVNFDMERIVSDSGCVIVDVGGDDSGAYALGQYASLFNSMREQTDMFYVINCYRYLTKTPAEAIELMYEIENASRMKHTGIINNSSLGAETSAEDIEKSCKFAEETARIANLPLIYTTYRKGVDISVSPGEELELFIKPIWEM
ncbi:cobalamin biosynthesis protein CobQ [Porcipelethomonas sp.]|uniref:cobalamin biosynthesis protein CobQ n=1 Tax=Porcipelethomonas sp. TaxID=2981675 RepID=UPI003EF879A0